MRKLYLSVVASMCLATGCRTTENLAPAVPLASHDAQQPIQDVEFSRDSNTGPSEPPVARVGESTLRSLPPVKEHPRIQLVDFNQEAVDPAPPPMPETLPEPPMAESLVSDLSLADLESIALQHNPVLAESAARVEAAQGNWQQVGLAPNPVVGYSGQQLGSGGEATQNGVFIGQEFVTGKKLSLNRERASWEVQRAQRELEAFQLRVLTDVRIGYYDVLIAQQRRDLAASLVDISEQGEEAANALFQGDEVSEADPLRASIEADTARILLQTASNQHVESWRRLTSVLGMPQLALQRLAGDLNLENIELTWQDTLRQVLSESPEIAAANANVQSARWAIERAYAEVIPNIEVQAIVQDDRGTGSTNGNLQVTLPIPLWNRNQGGIREAYWQAAAAERAVDRLALDLQSRLATAFQRYESARNQVEKYSRQGGLLEKSQRTLDLIRAGYRADEFGALELLSAQRTYFQTNLAYLDAQRELWTTAMEIRGLLLRESLTQ